MKDLQNLTNANLTDKENNLLEVLINPENRMKSVCDICKLANCSRPIYYKAFTKEGFVTAYNAKSRELVKQSVAPVINTFIREAQRGSFQHGKIILEMAGLYTEKQEIEHSGETTVKTYDLSKFTIDELKELIKK